MRLIRTEMNNSSRRRRARHGFTLVELVVVITIIAIIAAVGITALIGYIDQSRYEKNAQNAITVYQAAQTALMQKTSGGLIDPWTDSLVKRKLSSAEQNALIEGLDQENESNHTKLSLTFNPKTTGNPDDKCLYDLLSGYFYDSSVFAGTMAIELDVTATYGNGKVNYSASVLTAFYCEQNNSESGGWDDICLNTKGGGTADGLPYRDKTYRIKTSHVGLFDGTSESVSGPGGILPVALPHTLSYELDGHLIADSTNTGYLFNLRNGETLDVAWAIFDLDEDAPYMDHDENIKIILHTAEGAVFGNASSYGDVELEISKDKMQSFLNSIASRSETTVYESMNNNYYNITRTSKDGLINVDVTVGGSSKGTYSFPMTMTRVIGDGRKGCPDLRKGYYEFRLSLDCMMTRADESVASADRYNAERLFDKTPRNIYATLEGEFTTYLEDGSAKLKKIAHEDAVIAARAIDDPVYFTGMNKVNGVTNYCYFVKPEAAAYDEVDDEENDITGRCIVNTIFGDKKYSSEANGTSWTSAGGNAVITAFRHLYNIRQIESGTVTYRIVSDLDWYINKTGMMTVSEVRVYASQANTNRNNLGYQNVRYRTPATYETSGISIVSFPALNTLKSGQTLTSMSKADGEKFTINNVQMRTASFINKTDLSYGLICKNLGTIYNIYTNNLNLVLVNVKDGTASDYNKICPDTPVTFEFGASIPVDAHPVGGLVGINSGNIGSTVLTDDNVNTIRMSNTIIMTGSYWKANNNCHEVGGVIGTFINSGSMSGVIRFDGSFAVVNGGKDAAGILGDCKRDIGARLVVDGRPTRDAQSEFSLPVNSLTGKKLSCVVIGRGHVGGAIAYIEKCAMTYAPGRELTPDDLSVNSTTGKITFPKMDDEDYMIDVNLPSDSMIVKMGVIGDSSVRHIGGAIGSWLTCSGSYVGIRVNNQGSILATDTSKNVLCGGAIGRETTSSISTVYVDIVNGMNSRVGSLSNTTGPVSTGGAFGLIEGTSATALRSGTLMINAVNDGVIVSRGAANSYGSGGAIGGVTTYVTSPLYISTVNNNQSQIIGTGNNIDNSNGTGGAIGSMPFNNSTTIPTGSVVYAENHGYITGTHRVGGAIGNAARIEGSVYAANYTCVSGKSATVNGGQYVGGAIGSALMSNYGTVQSILHQGAVINGTSFVGGATGKLQGLMQEGGVVRTIVKGTSSVTGSQYLVGGVSGDVRVDGTGSSGLIELKGDSSVPVLTVSGGAEYSAVGGAVGLLRSNVANAVKVSTPTQSGSDRLVILVDGGSEVGGAVGKLRSSKNDSSTPTVVLNNDATAQNINVDISVKLHPNSHIAAGNGGNVGGAVGLIETSGGTFGGHISVSSAAGSSSGGSYILGNGSCVGGAVGHFVKSAPNNVNTASGINVDFSSAAWLIRATGLSNSDEANVGGAVGYFEGAENGNTGTDNTGFPVDVKLGSSTVLSNGSNVGGAIGKNMIHNGVITVSASGSISGFDNVSGGIGYNKSNVTSITTVIAGEVEGNGDNVGGAVGLTERTVRSIDATLNSGADISGNYNVGGAAGRIASEVTDVAITVDSISVKINANKSITGKENLGGAVGIVGSNLITKDLIIKSITAEINTGTPISQKSGSYDTACIGGVIGNHFKGTLNSISLSGTGGSVNPSSANSDAPDRTVKKAALISGKGMYIGGVIGRSGRNTTDGALTNAKLLNLSVTGVGICVVSSDNSQYIGGCIGGCFANIGDNNSTATMNVNTVKTVFSASTYVGGFSGIMRRATTSDIYNVYMKLTVNLSDADIAGRSFVGGAFGELDGAIIRGRIDVVMDNGTRIGDHKGILEAESDEEADTEGCICVNAGGIAGKYQIANGQGTLGKISLNINDNESMIFAGSSDYSGLSVTESNTGVGGVFGQVCGHANNNNACHGNSNCGTDFEAYAYLICPNPEVSVYSANSHVGGFTGIITSGQVKGCFSTAVVKGEGENACVGGFVGRFDKGTINNCYCGGHTVGGQYIPLYENIIGKNNVGGFVGYIGPDVTQVKQSYSTASVRGINYVGGFAGQIYSTKSGLIDQDYCTGFVLPEFSSSDDSGSTQYYGSFAGFVRNASDAVFTNSKVVEAINKDMSKVGNITATIADGKLRLAKWNGYGNDHIRINKDSIYHKTAFDPVLQGDDVEFPLRTFISVQISGKWEGVHYGDWPVVPNEDRVITDSNVLLAQTEIPYNGSSVEPAVTVTFGSTVLAEGTDYRLVYWRNYKIGTAAVIVVGTGEYYGTVVNWFDITQASIDGDDFDISVPETVPYNNGEPVTPPVTVTYGDVTLVKDRDYTLEFTNNIEPGEATVTVTGQGNYTGTATAAFTILPTFTVSFETYGGTEIAPQIVVSGEKAVRPADDPTRTGHTFDGWFADDQFSEEFDFDAVIDGNKTVYAKWIAEQFEVSFVTGTGASTVDPQTVDYGTTATEPSKPTRTDYTFMGWYTDELYTSAYDFATPVTGDLTLYARWIENPIVSFNSMGGSEVQSISVEYNTPVEKPGDPTRSEYTFMGWFTEYTCEDSSKYDFSTPVTQSIELFAGWKKTPIVTFDYGFDSIVIRVPVPYGTKAEEPEVVRPGYSLDGWFFPDGSAYDFDEIVTEDIMIHAEWSVSQTFEITFETNGGTPIDTLTVLSGKTLNDYDVETTREGYIFSGWYVDPALSNQFSMDTEIRRDFTLYAKWVEDPSLQD
ncbi:prepilin-type N-terminal cleavage/methylation domain-containing protein/Listeria/Bacterioides repeat-containing protein [Ruminococcaceae bacterium YRB3002]|nr:prepilin-type N-terminal cleavage/methylation domain-containing protein/Listeria/Bacterioides repeat-containing protein [Ruminococcaceae bacterium YRB3002]